MDTNLLSRVVDDLVVCTAEHLPVTGEGRMRGDEIACRVAISISYFSVVDGGPISRRRLNAHRSTAHPGMAAQQCGGTASYLNHQLVGATPVGDEVRLDQ